ncbi:MAG: hypothetical protein LH475_11400 [Cryobacterium sp.]|uniref:hypothetical protein n=1 Tax=unclassified Cryobacterium TaxID=2649013 RepID=UPI001A27CCAC|nr:MULTISPECIES: hypothetical protein [unclassified Cryobacterium]MCY7405211.1 hypothetical protein [Cryobacterium sp.]
MVWQRARALRRVDLKNDRQAGVLRVQAAEAENGAPVDAAGRLAAVLHDAALWQGLGEFEVMPRSPLASGLAAERK